MCADDCQAETHPVCVPICGRIGLCLNGAMGVCVGGGGGLEPTSLHTKKRPKETCSSKIFGEEGPKRRRRCRGNTHAYSPAPGPVPLSQVKREVQALQDWHSVMGRKRYEEYWTMKTVQRGRPASDALGCSDGLRRFHWQAITPFAEFCPKGTVDDCIRDNVLKEECDKIHFRRLIFAHTDIELGDCSYLDTCRRLNICKFVHYQLLPSRDMIAAAQAEARAAGLEVPEVAMGDASARANYPGLPTSHWQNDFRGDNGKIKPLQIGMKIKPWLQAQWIQCDVRSFDISLLGALPHAPACCASQCECIRNASGASPVTSQLSRQNGGGQIGTKDKLECIGKLGGIRPLVPGYSISASTWQLP